MELKELAEAILPLAKEAGKVIMQVYADESSFQIESKSDNSPLTMADKLANDSIMEGLKRLSVQYPVISEENKMISYDQRKNYNRFWLVDPLDGTKEFIKRNGEFTVNIALIEHTQVVLGVVYVPVTGEMFWASKNNGAYYKNSQGHGALIARSFTLQDEGLRIVCSRSHINQETQDYISKLKDPKTVSRGSSLKFIILAKGEAEIYPRIGPTMEWDTAAAQIILEESGGAVVEFGKEIPLRYNKENLLNPYFIARANLS